MAPAGQMPEVDLLSRAVSFGRSAPSLQLATEKCLTRAAVVPISTMSYRRLIPAWSAAAADRARGQGSGSPLLAGASISFDASLVSKAHRLC